MPVFKKLKKWKKKNELPLVLLVFLGQYLQKTYIFRFKEGQLTPFLFLGSALGYLLISFWISMFLGFGVIKGHKNPNQESHS